jgi:hypothetical protein
MSTLPTEQQAIEAQSFMSQEIYGPALFDKLASYNVRPRTQAEAAQFLKLASELADKEARGLYKTAAQAQAEVGNPFLAHCLGQLGINAPSPAAMGGQLEKDAAEFVAQNPIAKNAALVYAHLLAGGQVEAPAAAA